MSLRTHVRWLSSALWLCLAARPAFADVPPDDEIGGINKTTLLVIVALVVAVGILLMRARGAARRRKAREAQGQRGLGAR